MHEDLGMTIKLCKISLELCKIEFKKLFWLAIEALFGGFDEFQNILHFTASLENGFERCDAELIVTN